MQELQKNKSFEELVDEAKSFISEEDRLKLKEAFSQLKATGRRTAKQIRPIVPIEEWVNSEYYLGQDVHNIYPFWKKHVANIFNSPIKINQVILSGAIGCLKTDTLYSTNKGFKTLSELLEVDSGIEVLSSTQKERVEVSNNHILGIKPTKKITLINGTEIEGSLDHKVKVYRNEEIVWEEFRNLSVGDFLVHSHLEEPFGDDKYDKDEAYVLGYLYGLGDNVKYEEKHNGKFLTVRLQNNLSNYNYIASVLVDMFAENSFYMEGSRITYSLKVEVNHEWLGEFSKAAKDRKLSKNILSLNREAMTRFLKGLFDASSKVNLKDLRIELYVNSLEKVKVVKKILAAFGINTYLTNNVLIIYQKENINIFQEKIGFGIDFKRKASKSLLEGLEKLETENVITFKNPEDELYFKNIEGYLVPISEIKDSEAEVGDIEVPSTHHYNIGGLISHNTGKSTVGALILIRKIYELSCYENISALFNLMGASRIAFAYLSVNKDQAMMTGFSLLQEWIDSIPYFRDHFPRKERMDSAMMWEQERLLFLAGSVANHFIGSNLLGAILDEANFFDNTGSGDIGGTVASKVSKLYINVRNRAASRFLINGVQESLSVLISSSQGASSFTEQQINKAKDDPHTYIVSPSKWDVTPHIYGKERFLVYTGGDGFDAHIIETIVDINTLLEQRKEKPLPLDMTIEEAYKVISPSLKDRIIQVPTELKQNFIASVVDSLRDFAGFSSSITTKFFQSVGEYNGAVNFEREHPFSKEQIVVSTTKHLTQEGFVPIKSYLLNGTTFDNINEKRYMHIDLSKTEDSTGISMGYISSWERVYDRVEYYETIGGEEQKVEETIKVPKVKIDFMLKINPPNKPNQISFGKIRDFIIHLREEMGIKFAKITFDQAFSAQLMQELDELGFPVAHLSVDRTSVPYDTLADLMYEHRLEIYDYQPFRLELFNLIRVPDRRGGYKVDHPVGGSKDIADSVAGTVFNAVSSENKYDIIDTELFNSFVEANKGRGDGDYKQEVISLLDKLKKSLYN